MQSQPAKPPSNLHLLLVLQALFAGPILWGLTAGRFLDPAVLILLALAIGLPLAALLRRRWRHTPARGDTTLLICAAVSGAYALLAGFDLLLDWHEPEQHTVGVLRFEVERVGLRGGVVTRRAAPAPSACRTSSPTRTARRPASTAASACGRDRDASEPGPPA